MIKKMPQRTCVACRQVKLKKQLIRVVRNAEGSISIDPTGKAPGRGAYICADMECIAKARKSKALDRALKIKIGEDIYNELEKYCMTEVSVDGQK